MLKGYIGLSGGVTLNCLLPSACCPLLHAHLDRPCELAARALLPRAGRRVPRARARGRVDGARVRADGRAGRGGGSRPRGGRRTRRGASFGEGGEPRRARTLSGALG